MNTNPRCSRCGGPTYRLSQTCFVCGRDQSDYAPAYVSEPRDAWSVTGRYPTRGQGKLFRAWAEPIPLPGFEGLT